MFDKLVVSTQVRRRTRTAKFFAGTSITYLLVIASAFAVSICLATPRLADSRDHAILLAPTLPASPPPTIEPPPVDSGHPSRPDFRSFRDLEDLVHQQPHQSRIELGAGLPSLGKVDGSPGGESNGSPDGIGFDPGGIGRDGKPNDAPPTPPDPPRPTPRSVETDNRPVRVPSTVLQGKVLERRVPIYPELARRIRLQGDVAVEVIISPEGHVESARAVSGHPMLIQPALEAARAWRFQPTLLNGVAVRVTGVITFVFKLND